MKIRNTAELRKRADWHYKYDHIRQGTYGEGSINGKPTYEGCAVGCLSTPRTFKALDAWLRQWLPDNYEKGQVVDIGAGPENMREILRKEFGICRELTIFAEEIFEGMSYHGNAINFVRDFAHALKEGSDVTDQDIEWFERETKERSYEETAEPFLEWLKQGAPVPEAIAT